jgi:hypothetical protein
VAAQRTFRFRHSGNLQAKFAEARQVLGMTIDYQKRFNSSPIGSPANRSESGRSSAACCATCG